MHSSVQPEQRIACPFTETVKCSSHLHPDLFSVQLAGECAHGGFHRMVLLSRGAVTVSGTSRSSRVAGKSLLAISVAPIHMRPLNESQTLCSQKSPTTPLCCSHHVISSCIALIYSTAAVSLAFRLAQPALSEVVAYCYPTCFSTSKTETSRLVSRQSPVYLTVNKLKAERSNCCGVSTAGIVARHDSSLHVNTVGQIWFTLPGRAVRTDSAPSTVKTLQ